MKEAGETGGDSLGGAIRIVPMHRRRLREVLAIEEEAYPRPWSSALFLSELAQRESRRYTLATVGPIVAGYAGLMVVLDEGHVNTVTVAASWRRRGVGTVLLLDLARAAIERGVHHLTLEVRTGNLGAQDLYRRFGFAPVGVRKNYYSETNEDAVVMWARDVDTASYLDRLANIEASVYRTDGPDGQVG